MMRRFVLVRHKDVTGNSGVGIIGEGVAWTGGPAFLHWVTEYESFVHWPGGLEAILAVHGHGGSTIARWLDDPPADPPPTSPIDEDPYEHPLETFDREDR
jgi:hypothetical protein